MFWQNAVEYLSREWVLELSNLCNCVQHPWKLTGRDFWSSRNKGKPLYKEKCVWQEMLLGYLRNGECWERSNLCNCVHLPENLLVGISGVLGMKESHILSPKCVLRKCCGVSQKWWIARAVCKSSLLWYWWGSIAQSRFICQVWYTGIHGISALVQGGFLEL